MEQNLDITNPRYNKQIFPVPLNRGSTVFWVAYAAIAFEDFCRAFLMKHGNQRQRVQPIKQAFIKQSARRVTTLLIECLVY